ncbi:MAG: OmpH family outer membrane protein [Sphingobacteriaceae bacterium]|nr:OmpH family outer membrane protein [Sphingobacteriaceae bacterium]
MKRSIRKAVFILAATVCTASLSAQKIAHISLDSLVSLMPETKTAKDVAQNYLKNLEGEIAKMTDEFQKKYSDYMAAGETMSELVRKTKEEELTQMQRRIEDFRGQAQQDYQKKYGELTAPIMEKAKKGIEAVAKEGGYKYVLDTSMGNVLYTEPGDDILLSVKKKLDGMPLANIPGATGQAPVKKDAPQKTPPNPGKAK